MLKRVVQEFRMGGAGGKFTGPKASVFAPTPSASLAQLPLGRDYRARAGSTRTAWRRPRLGPLIALAAAAVAAANACPFCTGVAPRGGGAFCSRGRLCVVGARDGTATGHGPRCRGIHPRDRHRHRRAHHLMRLIAPLHCCFEKIRSMHTTIPEAAV